MEKNKTKNQHAMVICYEQRPVEKENICFEVKPNRRFILLKEIIESQLKRIYTRNQARHDYVSMISYEHFLIRSKHRLHVHASYENFLVKYISNRIDSASALRQLEFETHSKLSQGITVDPRSYVSFVINPLVGFGPTFRLRAVVICRKKTPFAQAYE